MASCTRPSSADESRSRSPLSTPPVSAWNLATKLTTAEAIAKDVEEVEIDLQSGLAVVNRPFDTEVYEVDVEHGIRPYVNPNVEFDYYNQSEAQEGSEVEQKAPEPTEKFPFQKLIGVEVFGAYLRDPQDMTYEELYRRTAVVSDSLNAWLSEWDQIDKEIFAHESMLKTANKVAAELAKEISEKERIQEDFEQRFGSPALAYARPPPSLA